MLIEDHYLYLLADREFYEPIDRFPARTADYQDLVRRLLPRAWTLRRSSVWVHCLPPAAQLPDQGWKIHLSATLANSNAVLATAARLLVPLRVPFKFLLDKTLLLLVNGKRWPRGGAGKFVTLYPCDTAQCGELLERLHQAMIGYSGPYILSDRRYRDSSVVYYRYGGISAARRLTVEGRSRPVMQAPDGHIVDDDRMAYFQLPQGVEDPFCTSPLGADVQEGQEEGTLGAGRYQIQSVIAFSNSGGVYVALDRESGRRVIVKEARPFTNVSPRGTDAVWLLKKEHRLLALLDGLAIAPRPVDFFRDWEHYYLVEELLEGLVLRSYTVQSNLALRTRATRAEAREFYRGYYHLFARIARLLAQIHERRIVFSDLSHYNVMVLEDGEEVRLIDFEGAYEQGVDPPTSLFTPGFAPAQRLEEGEAQPEDDLFAFGGLLLAGLVPMNALLALNPEAHLPFLAALQRDLGLPAPLARLIRRLLHPRRELRPPIAEVLEVLETGPPASLRRPGSNGLPPQTCERLLQQTLDYLEAQAEPSRDDRLFPADPAVFETNPLSVAHGACGVAYVLCRTRGEVPLAVRDWILEHDSPDERFAPGLYSGLAGVAWTLLELGAEERACTFLARAQAHPLRWQAPDLFYGAAGLGLAQLRFHLATRREEHLGAAQESGDFLLTAAAESDAGLSWPSQGDLCAGLAHGASGVSLFLLYLYLATREERYLEAGLRGLDFVAARAWRNYDGGLTWYAKEGAPTHTPYWRWGSAGVGIALLRYWRVLRLEKHAALLRDLLVDTDRKYTIFPGWFFGLAGIGEFYLDLAALWDEPEVGMKGARKILSGILPFQLDKGAAGVAFPGESLSRISCDFGTGSAGIAHFLHRYLHGGPSAFLLDELLPI